MTREEIENVGPEIEMLARMWIECDPNRSAGADGFYTLFIDGHGEKHPRWKWFIPRAQATADYLRSNGCVLSQQPAPIAPELEGE